MKTAKQIISEVADSRGLCSCKVMTDGSRNRPAIHARWEAMYRMRTETDNGKKSLTWIASFFKVDHTTVLHGIKRHKELTGEIT